MSFRSHVNNFSISSSGSFAVSNSVGSQQGTRPVINLKADVTISKGDGSSLNPFIVKTEV